MKRILFCVYDTKSGQHGNPFIMESDESAKRSFLDSLAEVRMPTLLSKFPTDYELRRLGTYDTETGALSPEKPTLVANAATFGARLAQEIQKRQALMIPEDIVRSLEDRCKTLEATVFHKNFIAEVPEHGAE